MQTLNFKTKTFFVNRKNYTPAPDEKFFRHAVDIGYSSVKGFSENSVFCFPSFAKKVDENKNPRMFKLGEKDIQYRDAELGLWYVGELAQLQITEDDSIGQALFGRKRYFTPMFKVLARTGIALGMRNNEEGSPNGKTLILQTGLPPKYIQGDSKLLREVFTGNHTFEIKIGEGSWMKFSIDLPSSNIKIMMQPLGSLNSLIHDKDGNKTPDAEKILNKNTNLLIDDVGYYTDDLYEIKNGSQSSYDTKTEFSMHEVFKNTSDRILKEFEVEIPPYAIQNCLETGTVTSFDITTGQKIIDFSNILEDVSNEICDNSLKYLDSEYNYLQNYNFLVVTGGTGGAAWFNKIKQHYEKMINLKVVNPSSNDTLGPIFSNVRGYFYYLVDYLASI